MAVCLFYLDFYDLLLSMDQRDVEGKLLDISNTATVFKYPTQKSRNLLVLDVLKNITNNDNTNCTILVAFNHF